MKPSDLNQLELIRVLADYMEEKEIHELIPRHLNAMIKGVNVMLEEFKTPYQPAVPGMGLKFWLVCDDVGASSRWLASFLSRKQFNSPYAYPHDYDDLNRCFKMIEAVPELKIELEYFLNCPQLKLTPKEWQIVFSHWNDWKNYTPETVNKEMNQLL